MKEKHITGVSQCPHCWALVPVEDALSHEMFHRAISEMAKGFKILWADYRRRNN